MSGAGERRAVDLSVELDAPPDVVWKALTDAEQLRSWFPLDAQVEPGEGGRILVSWGDAPWESKITVWDPPRHLQLRDPVPPDAEAQPVPIVVDYHLEGRGGRTVLRLVHSGFDASAEWDEFFDSLEGGWNYFLLNLEHYLSHHRGVPRRMVWKRQAVERGSRQTMWPVILRRLGLDAEARPGDFASIRIGPETLRGSVLLVRPPSHIATTLPDLEDGLFFLELEPCADQWKIGIWISTYGVAEQRVRDLQQKLNDASGALASEASASS